MTTPKRESRSRRIRKKHTRANARSTPEIEQNVDGSPAAVEARREAQSGPGATGVAHTGEGPDTPGAGAAARTRKDEIAVSTDDEEVGAAAREHAHADGPGSDEPPEPAEHAEPAEPAEIEETLRPPQEKHGH